MVSVISALDSKRMPTGEGWNGHPQHEWETDSTVRALRERFVQLYFQQVRGSEGSNLNFIKDLVAKQSSLMTDLREKDPEDHSGVMDLLLRLPLHTRDIRGGKGERMISYAQLLLWYDYGELYSVPQYKSFAEQVFRQWLGVDGGFPLGSWKDVKLFAEFVKQITEKNPANHPLVLYGISLLTDQLRWDKKGVTNPSLAAKWTPSEKCKRFSWIFRKVADGIFPPPPKERVPVEPKEDRASRHRKLRKMLSELNRKIRTTEVMMCGKTWSEIDFTRVSSVTLQKHKRAFLNLPKPKLVIRKGRYVTSKFPEQMMPINERERGDAEDAEDVGVVEGGGESSTAMRYELEDRIRCAANLRELVAKSAKGDKSLVKATTTSLYDLVKDAIQLSTEPAECDERMLLEEQWKGNRSVNRPGLPPMIPMVDVSGSMAHPNHIPMFNAIALGLRASEMTHPVFRNRIMTFSESPSWVVLPKADGFVERVRKIRQAPWGMNTDFYKALDMILDTLVSNSVPPEEAKGMVLAVFSDMQIDMASRKDTSARLSMQQEIQSRYAEAGYDAPHILYWNLDSETSGFPNVSTELNTTMVSGFSPALLNAFENKGIEELQTFTPFAFIRDILLKYRLLSDDIGMFDEIEEVLENHCEDVEAFVGIAEDAEGDDLRDRLSVAECLHRSASEELIA